MTSLVADKSRSSAKRARHQLGASSARAAAVLCHLLPGGGGPPPFVAHTLWTAGSGRRCRLCGRGCQLFGVRARCETIEVARRGDAAALEARLAARPVCRGSDAGMIVCAIAASRHVPAALMDVVHAAYPTAVTHNPNAWAMATRSDRADMAQRLCDLGANPFRFTRHGHAAVRDLFRAEAPELLLSVLQRCVREGWSPAVWQQFHKRFAHVVQAALSGQLRSLQALVEAGFVRCTDTVAKEAVLHAVFLADPPARRRPEDAMQLLRAFMAHGGDFRIARGRIIIALTRWFQILLRVGDKPELVVARPDCSTEALDFVLSNGFWMSQKAAGMAVAAPVREVLAKHGIAA